MRKGFFLSGQQHGDAGFMLRGIDGGMPDGDARDIGYLIARAGGQIIQLHTVIPNAFFWHNNPSFLISI